MIETLVQPFQFPFMQNAFLVALIVGIVSVLVRPRSAGASKPIDIMLNLAGLVRFATAITPCPHIVLQPSLCMKSTPACAPGVTGSVSNAPYMSAWPRGSSMMARRRWSRCFRAHSRRASMVAPCGDGRPSTTRRSGSPAVWASMVRIW